jgi:hypothetical protein
LGRILGFTGTRHGMTVQQKARLAKLLWGVAELHHGMCVGSDAECHKIARSLGGIWIVGHPPINKKLYAANLDVDELRESKDYLPRDWDIVQESEELIATPRTLQEFPRSGTWTTIGYGVKARKWVRIIYPDGKEEIR